MSAVNNSNDDVIDSSIQPKLAFYVIQAVYRMQLRDKNTTIEPRLDY